MRSTQGGDSGMQEKPMAGRTGELAADFWPRCPLAGRYQRQPAIRGDKCCLRPEARMGFRGSGHWPVDCRHANLVSARTSENQLRFSCLEVSVLRRRPTTTSSSYHPRFLNRKNGPWTVSQHPRRFRSTPSPLRLPPARLFGTRPRL